MAQYQVDLNSPDLEAILKGDEVRAALLDVGEQVRNSTGRPEDYEVDESTVPSRARVSVHTPDGNWAAHNREARDHLLLAAIAGMGGP